MCAECDRLEADRMSGALRDVAARAVADYIAGHFNGERQSVRNGTWDAARLTLGALAGGTDPKAPVRVAKREVS